MATKTITLEIDAYEKLRHQKRPGESFTEVVRRAAFPETPLTGAALLSHYLETSHRTRDAYLESVELAERQDPPPDDPWA